MKTQLTFQGAAGTVTGSRYHLARGKREMLVDAGLFQGLKRLRQRNWAPPSFAPRAVDEVLLTHCHLDHCGWLPRLVALGFRGKIRATPATIELAEVILADAAHLQEEDAHYANRKGHTRHKPALPLFDSRNAADAVRRMRPIDFDRWLDLGQGFRARWTNSGHILGAASIEVRVDVGGREIGVLFSGDVGRYDVPLHVDPSPRPPTDVLVIESTYGDRTHPAVDTDDQFVEAFGPTLAAGGVVLLPAFSVGRSQLVTLILRRLMKAGRLPEVPIHIDSPMAARATTVYSHFLDAENVDEDVFEDGRHRLFPENVQCHVSTAESKRLNELPGPFILIAGSGMMTGGRILHHIVQRGGDPKNLLCLAGYQAQGTRGHDIVEGATTLRIHGRDVKILAKRFRLTGLSGHADSDELMRWHATEPTTPVATFVTHGEPKSARALADRLAKKTRAWVHVPEENERFELGSLVPEEEGK